MVHYIRQYPFPFCLFEREMEREKTRKCETRAEIFESTIGFLHSRQAIHCLKNPAVKPLSRDLLRILFLFPFPFHSLFHLLRFDPKIQSLLFLGYAISWCKQVLVEHGDVPERMRLNERICILLVCCHPARNGLLNVSCAWDVQD